MIFPFKLYKISGHSMEPTLPVDSYVLTVVWAKKYRAGDIVVFKKEDSVFIKRIVSIKDESSFLLRGDNIADSLDSNSFGPIQKHDLVGKVVWY